MNQARNCGSSAIVIAVLAIQCFHCSADGADPVGKAGTGGASGADTSGTSGTNVTSGAAGAMSGATGGSGGGSAGGSSGGAGSESAGGSGMRADAGAGGGSADGGSAAATPSAGCGKGTGRPPNGTVTVSNAYYLAFPSTYNGTTPTPALLGFHGCGAGNRGTDLNSTEWMNLTKGTPFETEYVRAVPVSQDSGGCWTYGTDITRVTKMYDDLVANYCVDTSRVFATGHSSGAQFLVQVLAKKTDADHLHLKGVAPVAADPYNVAAPMPVMYIDGKMDNQRSPTSATNTVARFRAANMCADTSKPYTPVMTCKSSEGPMVDPGCIIYDGCTVPTIWCSHNDPSYGGTQHGVPCFAMKGMYDFIKSLP